MKKFFIFLLITSLGVNAFLLIPKAYIKIKGKFYLADQFNKDRLQQYSYSPLHNGDIIFVGTSITEGLPIELFTFEKIKNRGISWNRLDHIIARMPDLLKAHPKKMFLEAGINDYRYGDSISIIINKYKKLVNLIKQQSPTTIIYVQSCLPTYGSFSNLNPAILRLNSCLKALCKETAIAYIDVHSQILQDGHLTEDYTSDGLHPNLNGYKSWAAIIDSLVN